MDGKRDVNALMDRDFEAWPPRNSAEVGLKYYKMLMADPMARLKGEHLGYFFTTLESLASQFHRCM